jgi:tetratricopeptide (TPR) repeat protein
MSKRLIVFLAIVAISIATWGTIGQWGGAAAQEQSTEAVDEAYKKAMDERRTFDEIPDRLAITKAFLEQYPESQYTARLITHVFYYQGERLEDMPGAIAYAEELRAKIVDPDIVKDIDREMVGLYGDAGMTDKMVALATRLEDAGDMKFNDFWRIIEICSDNGNWEMVRTYSKKARPMANAETYRSDYPQYDFTDEEVEQAGGNRTAMVAGKDAWALANLGSVDDALVLFAQAGKTIKRSYIGVPDYDIGLHWANTLLMNGDYDGAMEMFAVEALVMGNEDAREGLKKAYVGKMGNETEFDKYADRLHREIAKSVVDFELPDYEGTRMKYADIRGDVTLLAFWFPT